MIEIPLSKTGKHAGKYVAIVSDEDKDLAELNWVCDSTIMYAKRCKSTPKKINIFMHRVIVERMIAPLTLQKGQVVDHINGDGLDNRRENLRVATHAQNIRNSKSFKNNTSGYKGVSLSRGGRYRAKIEYLGKQYWLGTYDTPEEAYEVYKLKAKEFFGEFARLGLKEGNSK